MLHLDPLLYKQSLDGNSPCLSYMQEWIIQLTRRGWPIKEKGGANHQQQPVPPPSGPSPSALLLHYNRILPVFLLSLCIAMFWPPPITLQERGGNTHFPMPKLFLLRKWRSSTSEACQGQMTVLRLLSTLISPHSQRDPKL